MITTKTEASFKAFLKEWRSGSKKSDAELLDGVVLKDLFSTQKVAERAKAKFIHAIENPHQRHLARKDFNALLSLYFKRFENDLSSLKAELETRPKILLRHLGEGHIRYLHLIADLAEAKPQRLGLLA